MHFWKKKNWCSLAHWKRMSRNYPNVTRHVRSPLLFNSQYLSNDVLGSQQQTRPSLISNVFIHYSVPLHYGVFEFRIALTSVTSQMSPSIKLQILKNTFWMLNLVSVGSSTAFGVGHCASKLSLRNWKSNKILIWKDFLFRKLHFFREAECNFLLETFFFLAYKANIPLLRLDCGNQ